MGNNNIPENSEGRHSYSYSYAICIGPSPHLSSSDSGMINVRPEKRIACKIIAELQGIDPWWWYRNQLLFRVGVAFHSCEEIATLLTVARCIHHPENSVHSEEGLQQSQLFRRGPVSGNFSN